MQAVEEKPPARVVKCGYKEADRVQLISAEREICELISPFDKHDQDVPFPLELILAELDLNLDGSKETIIWESSWAGTGGGLLVILGYDKKYFRIFEIPMTWAPVIVLDSTTNSWKDIAFFQTGGGVPTGYVILKHDGKSYNIVTEPIESMPNGETVIQKNWQNSVFGPVPK